MAYNKSKSAEAAQKHLSMGKVSHAIAEYQQILRYEPRDQVTLMTIGDLFVRQGDTIQALEYFERLAQLFLSDGFVTKAIAIYKKIAKLAPEEGQPLEKLAELYVQQGVMSEARPIYLQLAEVHLKAKRHAQAVGLLQKLLEAEPDNLRVQTRLGDLYHAMGEDGQAVKTLVAAAQRLLDRGEHAEAERLADRALKIEHNHPHAMALKARALTAAGKGAAAAHLLESLPGLEAGSEVGVLLIDQYLQSGQTERAAALAHKVIASDPKNYELAFKVANALIEAGTAQPALELIGPIREPMIDAGEPDRLAQALTAAAERLPGQLEPLEWLVELYGRINDSFRLPDALGQLGEAAAAAGKLDRARQVYEQLVDRNPENEAARRSLNQVLARMGSAEVPAAEDLGAGPKVAPVMPLEEAQPRAPSAEPPLDEETSGFITQALTDVDLFSSYGLTQKAIDLLETVLQRAPRHTSSLEKLLDLNLGAGDDRRTAELAGQLEKIYHQRDDSANAERFAELRRRFQRAAGLTQEEVTAAAHAAPPPEFTVPAVEAEPVPMVDSEPVAADETPAAGEAAVHEVDLSEEWAAMTELARDASPSDAAVSPAPEPVAAAPPERQAAPKQVELPSPPPAEVTPPPSAIPELPAEVQVGSPAELVTAPLADAESEYEIELTPVQVSPPVQAQAGHAAQAEGSTLPQGTATNELLNELATEFEALGSLHAALSAAPPAPPAAKRPMPPPPPAAPPRPQRSASPQRTAGKEVADPLSDVFEEFRAELGEMGEEEDLETHYNLGIAYREMGLLEEAIGEFQKVAKANDQGRAFRYGMQCCTLLGLAFMEKGQPEIALMWYERALQTPGLDQESVLALRYDLGVAQELAGDTAAAMKSFSQVYAVNIDYRDVAERIVGLGKSR